MREAVEVHNKMTHLKNDLYACLSEIRLIAPDKIVAATGSLYDAAMDRDLQPSPESEASHLTAHTAFIAVVKATIGTREALQPGGDGQVKAT